MRRRSRNIFKMFMLSKLIQLQTKKQYVLIFLIIPFQMKTNPEILRRITNASSVFQGQSLNSNHLKAPNLLSNLVGVVLGFREQQVATSADIEQMFMQIKVAPSDRPFLRFFWNHNGEIEEYEYTRLIFGAPSSPGIASYAICRSARDNQDKFPQVLHLIERNVYMDDLYISTADVEIAVNFMNSTEECLSLGGFNLTKWNSNSDKFLINVANENLSKPDLPSPQPQQVLGLPWNASTDEYIIENKLFKRFPNDQFTTRRKLLKFVASIFDPLGVIAPLTIRLRKILQVAWKKVHNETNLWTFSSSQTFFNSKTNCHLTRKSAFHVLSSVETRKFSQQLFTRSQTLQSMLYQQCLI